MTDQARWYYRDNDGRPTVREIHVGDRVALPDGEIGELTDIGDDRQLRITICDVVLDSGEKRSVTDHDIRPASPS